MPSLPASMRKPWRRPAAVVRAAVVLIAVEPPLGLASTVGNPTSFPSRSQLDNSCKCRHPIRKGACYEPVCPEGYFKCCATCELSTCASQGALYSYRGVRECVQCLPGDFCDGCDSFQSCPTVTREGKEVAKISQRGSKMEEDCLTCSVGEEPDLQRSACITVYSHVCSKSFLERCTQGCDGADSIPPTMTPCEQMKCIMYCARLWSDECADALRRRCEFLRDFTPNNRSGAAVAALENWLDGCDVDCSGAPRWLLSAAAFMVVSLLALVA